MSNPTSKPAEVVRGYLAAFATGDPDLVASFVSDDFINEHTAKLGSGSVTKAAYRERLPSFLADMADLVYEVEQLVVQDGDVAAFYELSANWQGQTPVRVRGVQHLRVRDGLIVHRTDYWDSAVFLEQLETD